MRRIKITPKLCDYCNYTKPIFRNTPDGKQCIDCYRRDTALSDKPVRRAGKKTKKTKKKYDMDRADRLFSIYIRTLYSVGEGVSRRIPCYTCNEWMEFTEAECGHYVDRGNLATRWLPENARPQCYNCNCVLDGNHEKFRERLEYDTPGITEQLEELGKTLYKPGETDMKDIVNNLILALKEIR